MVPQVSPLVQALPSLQEPGWLANTHAPVLGSQVSAVQGLPSSHGVAVPVQVVPVQASASVHGLPSSQVLVTLGC